MECFDEPKLYVGCQIRINPARAGLVSRAGDGSRVAGSSYHGYAGRSADEQKKSCGLIACPALRDRPRQNASRSARTDLTAPCWAPKDADPPLTMAGDPPYLLWLWRTGRRHILSADA